MAIGDFGHFWRDKAGGCGKRRHTAAAKARGTWAFCDCRSEISLFGGLAGGETGIRTLETIASLHTFQACAFDHSATSPIQQRTL